MLPDQIPVLPGWNIALKFHSTQLMRSEFHDLLLLPDGKLMVVSGRMEGSGMICSFNIATLRAALRSLAVLPLTPAEVMRRCNSLLMLELQAGNRMSCLYSILDPLSGRMSYVSAGNQHPYFCSIPTSTNTIQSDPLLGESWDTEFSQKEIILKPEECVVFTSAGYINARNKYLELFGEMRVLEILGTSSTSGKGYLDALEEAVQEFTKASGEGSFEYTLNIFGEIA